MAAATHQHYDVSQNPPLVTQEIRMLGDALALVEPTVSPSIARGFIRNLQFCNYLVTINTEPRVESKFIQEESSRDSSHRAFVSCPVSPRFCADHLEWGWRNLSVSHVFQVVQQIPRCSSRYSIQLPVDWKWRRYSPSLSWDG